MAAAPATSEGPSDPSRSLRDEPSNKLFDDPDADIILRSCDSQEFRVLKLYMIKSSPVLKKLILATASDPPDTATLPDSGTPLPVVEMPESGSILSSLLTFIFPMSPTLPKSVEAIMELLSVAQEYKMSSILYHIRGCISLQDPPFIHRENAFHIYSLAQKHGLLREVAQGARLTLKVTLTIENLEDKLYVMPGAYLYELWKYHCAVRTNILSCISEFRQSNAHGTLTGLSCVYLTRGIPKWIDVYIYSVATTPSSFDLIEFQTILASHIQGTKCSYCAHIPSQKIHVFWSALTAVVHRSMEMVSVFDINEVACSYNSYRPNQLSPW
jgi:BTB/POZ domain